MSRKRGAWEWLWWITDGHPDLWHSEAVLAACLAAALGSRAFHRDRALRWLTVSHA